MRKVIASYVGENKEFERQALAGEIEVDARAAGDAGRAHPRGGRRDRRVLHADRLRHHRGRRERDADDRRPPLCARDAAPRRLCVGQGVQGRQPRQPRVPEDGAQLQSRDGNGRDASRSRKSSSWSSPARSMPTASSRRASIVTHLFQGRLTTRSGSRRTDRAPGGDDLGVMDKRERIVRAHRARAARRRLREPGHRIAYPGGQLRAGGYRHHASLRERHARRRSLSARVGDRSRSGQRRQGDGDRAAGRGLLQQRRLVCHGARRAHRHDGARRARGRRVREISPTGRSLAR